MMKKTRRTRLLDLEADVLVDALLQLARCDDAADDLVERMIATPRANIQRFKLKLASLKRSRRFVRWGESAGFARELEALLQDLQAGVDDPRTGAELMVTFYETDNGTLGHCDDSSGHIGDVYRFDGKELFVRYAQHCSDKEWLANLVFTLNRKDDYGVRDTLIGCAAEYLPELNIRTVIGWLEKLIGEEKDEYKKRHWFHLIESLARQIGDARLFETTRIASWGTLSTAACVDIATVYLESGDPRAALSWLNKISSDESYQSHERDQLLGDIYGLLGETEKQSDVAWRVFRRHRCKDSLDALLSVVGVDQRAAITMGEVHSILARNVLSLQDATFLVELGCLDEAEIYLLDCGDQLNGDFYGSLIPLAEAMESSARHLASTIVYRALLDSILRRGQTKSYSHGVRYLKTLDRLAKSVSGWRSQDDHVTYLQQLRQIHGKKFSFWSRYEKLCE